MPWNRYSFFMIYSISHESCIQFCFGLDQAKTKLCAYSMGYTVYDNNQRATTWKEAFVFFHSLSPILGCTKIAWTCSCLWLHPVQCCLLPLEDSSHRLLYIDMLKASGHLNTCTNGKLILRGTLRQQLCHNIELPITSCMAEDQCICPQ